MVPLESVEIFKNLPPAEMASLQRAAMRKPLTPGQEIFKEGDKGDGIYIVGRGTIEISTLIQGERKVLARREPGDIFGEMAVVDDRPRSASAASAGAAEVYFVSRDHLYEMLERTPRLSLALLKEISSRLRDFNRHYVDEVLQSERLALVGRFARAIIHDLKNPLNIISLSAEMAGTDTASLESRRASKSRIRKQVDRITNMVNELLEFTRGGRASFVPATVNYAEFVTQTVDELRQELSIKGAELEFENEPPPVDMRLDPGRLTRVFHNLLHNAADAMPKGGKVIFRFRCSESEIITELEDTGKGIAPEVADKLFRAFVTFGKAHGTGLGLSICQKIVEDHGGKIFARVEPGRGAIFIFHLPRSADSTGAAAQ
jgi:signal transduction histidine kinase